MPPLIQQLATRLRDAGLNSAFVDFADVKFVSAPHGFAMNCGEVCCDYSNGILLFPKTLELRVAPVSPGLADQYGLRQ